MRDPLGHASQRRQAGQAAAPGDHERGVEVAGGVGDGVVGRPRRVEDHRLGSRRGHDLRRMLGEAGPERRLVVTRADDGDVRSVPAGDPRRQLCRGVRRRRSVAGQHDPGGEVDALGRPARHQHGDGGAVQRGTGRAPDHDPARARVALDAQHEKILAGGQLHQSPGGVRGLVVDEGRLDAELPRVLLRLPEALVGVPVAERGHGGRARALLPADRCVGEGCAVVGQERRLAGRLAAGAAAVDAAHDRGERRPSVPDVGLRSHDRSFAHGGRRHSRAGHASGSVGCRRSSG